MEGRSKREGTNAYLWLIHVMYGRNEHNIVKQLSSNKKKKAAGIRAGRLLSENPEGQDHMEATTRSLDYPQHQCR